MLPVQQNSSIRKHQSDVHHRILQTDALVRAAAKHEVVARVLVRAALGVEPALGQERIRVGVRLRVVQRVVERRDDHAVHGHGVVVRDRERLRRLVRHHRHRRPQPQALLHHRAQVRHRVHHLERDRLPVLPATHALLLLAHAREHRGVVREVLQAVDEPAAHRVLAREEEREEHHRHLEVAKVAPALVLRVREVAHPLVEHALRLRARGHRALAQARRALEVRERRLARLDRAVHLRAREREREVDELERDGDQPVLVRDLPRRRVADVRAAEDAEGRVHVEVAREHHDRLRRRVLRGLREPLAEVLARDRVLDADVHARTAKCGEISFKQGVIRPRLPLRTREPSE